MQSLFVIAVRHGDVQRGNAPRVLQLRIDGNIIIVARERLSEGAEPDHIRAIRDGPLEIHAISRRIEIKLRFSASLKSVSAYEARMLRPFGHVSETDDVNAVRAMRPAIGGGLSIKARQLTRCSGTRRMVHQTAS